MKKNKSNRKKVIGVIIAVLVLIPAFFAVLVFADNDFVIPKSLPSVEIIEKIGIAQLRGGEAQITTNDINALINFAGIKGFQKNGIQINGIFVEIKFGKVVVYNPVEFKGFKFLLKTKFDIGFENNKYVFSPESFKVGLLSIPKGIVLSKIKGYLPEFVELKDNRFYINKSKLIVDTKALNVKEDIIYLKLGGYLPVQNNPSVNDSATAKNDNKPSTDHNSTNSSKGTGKGNTTKSNKSSNTNTNININYDYGDQKTAKLNRQKVLNRARGQLSAAAARCKSAGEKQIIAIGQKVLNRIISNPTYDYSGDAGAVRAIYGKLTREQQLRVKNAVLSNVSVNEIMNAVYSK